MRSAARSREHQIVPLTVRRLELVLGEHARELRKQRDLANRGSRLRCDTPGGHAAVCTRELRARTDQPTGEVDVLPDQAE